MIDLNALVIGPAISAWGQSVTYTPFIPTLVNGALVLNANGDPTGDYGTPYTATGVFDEQFMEITPLGAGPFVATEGMEFGATGGISDAMPVLGVQLSAMQTVPAQYDRVTIGAVVYQVKEPRPDGHGWAKLLLNIAP